MAEARRLKLHEEFCDLLGSRDVYYQPPESLKMSYPCIRYNPDGFNSLHADNRNYKNTQRYSGIVIDPDPDSAIPELLLEHFAMCSIDRAYTSNNLNHFAFTIYY